MEILNESAALLSNHEVYSLISDTQPRQGKKKPSQNLSTITYTTMRYLERTPCVVQNKDVIETFVKAMQPFELKKAEILQLLNLRPTTHVEIQLIVEETEDRLTEEQVDNLLEIIATILPPLPEPSAAN
jgi:DNA-directed RNA polymerase subunit F